MKTKNKITKNLLCGIGGLILFTFTAPILGNIFNIANILGITLGFCFLIFGIFYEKIIFIIKKILKNKIGKTLFSICLTIICAAAICFAAALGSVIASSTTNATNQSTVIVLGCAVYGDVPSTMLSARINEAYNYLEQNDDAVAILSGGQGNGENISEAECMFNILTEKGIDKSRLFIEDSSTNTAENLEFSNQIIQDNNLNTEVAIATSDFHLKRAAMIAERQGLTPHRISARSGFFAIPTFYIRDTLGVIKEFIFR